MIKLKEDTIYKTREGKTVGPLHVPAGGTLWIQADPVECDEFDAKFHGLWKDDGTADMFTRDTSFEHLFDIVEEA